MSVSHGILSILAEGPQHGYALRESFEAATGSAWPLNVGQVYTTLGRLERDGFVEPVAPVADEADGRNAYQITNVGREYVERWFHAPIPRDGSARDELVAKIALAVANPVIDTLEVIHIQRASTLVSMQALTKRIRAATAAGDLAARLAIDSQLFHAEAEVRWLDHCINQLAASTSRSTSQTIEGTT